MSQAQSQSSSVIVINTFTPKEATSQKELLDKVVAGVRKTAGSNPGFEGATILKAVDGSDIVNISRWSDLDVLASNHGANEANPDYVRQMAEIEEIAASAPQGFHVADEITSTRPTDRRFAGQIDVDDCALVLVDFLDGFWPGLRTIDKSTYNHNVTAFASLGAIFKMPTFVLGDEGGFRGNFFSQMPELVADAPRFGRHTPSAFRSGGFREALEASGRKTVVLGGISLDNCVMLTSLDLLAAGYDVRVVVDASGTESTLVENASMLRLTQAGAVVTSWVTLASELMKDWETEAGPKVGALYQHHSAWGAMAPSLEEETQSILAAEQQLCRAVLDRDLTAAAAVLDDALTAIGHAGNMVGKTAYLDIHFSPDRNFVRFDPEDQDVRIFGDTAIVLGKVTVINDRITNNPPPARYSATYVRRDGVWRVLIWQETPIDAGARY